MNKNLELVKKYMEHILEAENIRDTYSVESDDTSVCLRNKKTNIKEITVTYWKNTSNYETLWVGKDYDDLYEYESEEENILNSLMDIFFFIQTMPELVNNDENKFMEYVEFYQKNKEI